MDKEFNVNIEKGTKELVVRKGDALPMKEPSVVSIVGNIDSVSRYLKSRLTEITQKKCHVIVDRDAFSIKLAVDEHNHYQDSINGVLTFSKEFKSFGINAGKEYTSFEMADFIRMNRSFFQKANEAAELVTSLRSFKAKVNREIENSDDNRGNREVVRRQVVESNLPKAFKLEMEVFKGQGRVIIEVEVDIDADSLNCFLVSPQTSEIIQTCSGVIIDGEIGAITAMAPELLIIEC